MLHSTTLGFSSTLLRSLRKPGECPFCRSDEVQFFSQGLSAFGECFLCGETWSATEDEMAMAEAAYNEARVDVDTWRNR